MQTDDLPFDPNLLSALESTKEPSLFVDVTEQQQQQVPDELQPEGMTRDLSAMTSADVLQSNMYVFMCMCTRDGNIYI